jgi:8-oxo-dGTP diphosphatase
MRIVGCFLEFDGKFLILLRHVHKPNGGTWGLPAGKVEPGESDEAAIIRELSEETGYQAKANELEHLGDFEFKEESPYIFSTFRIKLKAKPKTILEDSSHQAVNWVDAKTCSQIPNLIHDLNDLLGLVGYI